MPNVRHLTAKSAQLAHEQSIAHIALHKVKKAILGERAVGDSLKVRWTRVTGQIRNIRSLKGHTRGSQQLCIASATHSLSKIHMSLQASHAKIKKLHIDEAKAFQHFHSADAHKRKIDELLVAHRTEKATRDTDIEEDVINEQFGTRIDHGEFFGTVDPSQITIDSQSFNNSKSSGNKNNSEPEPPKESSAVAHFEAFDTGHNRISIGMEDKNNGHIKIEVETINSELTVVCSVEDALTRSRLRERLKRGLERSGISVTRLTVTR